MLTPEWKNVRVWALVGVMAVGATASLAPAGGSAAGQPAGALDAAFGRARGASMGES